MSFYKTQDHNERPSSFRITGFNTNLKKAKDIGFPKNSSRLHSGSHHIQNKFRLTSFFKEVNSTVINRPAEGRTSTSKWRDKEEHATMDLDAMPSKRLVSAIRLPVGDSLPGLLVDHSNALKLLSIQKNMHMIIASRITRDQRANSDRFLFQVVGNFRSDNQYAGNDLLGV